MTQILTKPKPTTQQAGPVAENKEGPSQAQRSDVLRQPLAGVQQERQKPNVPTVEQELAEEVETITGPNPPGAEEGAVENDEALAAIRTANLTPETEVLGQQPDPSAGAQEPQPAAFSSIEELEDELGELTPEQRAIVLENLAEAARRNEDHAISLNRLIEHARHNPGEVQEAIAYRAVYADSIRYQEYLQTLATTEDPAQLNARLTQSLTDENTRLEEMTAHLNNKVVKLSKGERAYLNQLINRQKVYIGRLEKLGNDLSPQSQDNQQTAENQQAENQGNNNQNTLSQKQKTVLSEAKKDAQKNAEQDRMLYDEFIMKLESETGRLPMINEILDSFGGDPQDWENGNVNKAWEIVSRNRLENFLIENGGTLSGGLVIWLFKMMWDFLVAGYQAGSGSRQY